MFRLQSSVEVGTHQQQGSLQWLPCFFFLFNRPFVVCAFGSKLLVLFAKIVICPERSNHSALFSCRPASMGCTSLSGRSLSEAFRLLYGCRIVAVISRATFVPSRGDIRLFSRRHLFLLDGTFVSSRRDENYLRSVHHWKALPQKRSPWTDVSTATFFWRYFC